MSGAVERVERFIVAAPHAGERSGVVGLRKDRVGFGGRYGRPCIGYFTKSGTKEAANARKAFADVVGRDAAHIGGAYSLSSITIPDMELINLAPRGSRPAAPDGFDQVVWREALRFSPRGFVRFDPSDVVSMKPAKTYPVLPQQIGLAQLVSSGHLEREGSYFRIVRPIAHFPAGLNGSHSVIFVLAKGVPMPAGDPGHSCVLAEETGEPVVQAARCRLSRDRAKQQGTFP